MLKSFIAVILLVVLCVAPCFAAGPYGIDRQLKVGFIYPTSINDFGYTYSNEIARVTVERELHAEGASFQTAEEVK